MPGSDVLRVTAPSSHQPPDCAAVLQAPMSRHELDTFLNDRYAAMDERLKVGCM